MVDGPTTHVSESYLSVDGDCYPFCRREGVEEIVVLFFLQTSFLYILMTFKVYVDDNTEECRFTSVRHPTPDKSLTLLIRVNISYSVIVPIF